jgi:hypothetical protein
MAALPSSGTRPSAPDGYNLVRTYKQGEVDKYRTKLKIEGSKTTIEFNLATTESVKEAKPDGTYVLVTKMNSGTVTIGGAANPFAGVGQTVTATYDRTGNVLKSEPQAGKGGIGDLIAITRWSFSTTDDLKIGESRKFEVPFGSGANQKASGTIKVLSLEKPGNEIKQEAVKVQTVATIDGLIPQSDKSVKLDTVSLIDPKSAVAYKLTGTISDLPLGSLGTGKITFERTRTN